MRSIKKRSSMSEAFIYNFIGLISIFNLYEWIGGRNKN